MEYTINYTDALKLYQSLTAKSVKSFSYEIMNRANFKGNAWDSCLDYDVATKFLDLVRALRAYSKRPKTITFSFTKNNVSIKINGKVVIA
jgi:hypothetical protein